MMSTELHDLMARAMDDVIAPPTMLEHSIQRGRRLRRRLRQRRAVIASVALAAATAATIAMVVPTLGGSRPGGPTIATAPPGPRWWEMPPEAMAERLRETLPPDVHLGRFKRTGAEYGRPDSDKVVGVLDGVLRTPQGRGGVNVMLNARPEATTGSLVGRDLTFDMSCPAAVDETATEISCTQAHDASGDVIGRRLEMTGNGVTVVSVTQLAGDGVVMVAAANSVQRKWGAPASAAEPPLTLDELIAIAQSPVWQSYIPSPAHAGVR